MSLKGDTVAVQCRFCGFISRDLADPDRWGAPINTCAVWPDNVAQGSHLVARFPKWKEDMHVCHKGGPPASWHAFKPLNAEALFRAIAERNDKGSST